MPDEPAQPTPEKDLSPDKARPEGQDSVIQREQEKSQVALNNSFSEFDHLLIGPASVHSEVAEAHLPGLEVDRPMGPDLFDPYSVPYYAAIAMKKPRNR